MCDIRCVFKWVKGSFYDYTHWSPLWISEKAIKTNTQDMRRPLKCKFWVLLCIDSHGRVVDGAEKNRKPRPRLRSCRKRITSERLFVYVSSNLSSPFMAVSSTWRISSINPVMAKTLARVSSTPSYIIWFCPFTSTNPPNRLDVSFERWTDVDGEIFNYPFANTT